MFDCSTLILLISIFFSIISIASTSIGIQCLGKSGDKDTSNHGYLVYILVISILILIASMVMGVVKYNQAS